MIKGILIAWAVFCVSTFAHSRPHDGQEGHGGDGVVAEFKLILADLGREIHKVAASGLPSQDFVERYLSLLEKVRVESKESLLLRGKPVDAINYPDANEPWIEVSRSSWALLTGTSRHLLALHETLPLLGFDDSDYRYSIPLIRKISEGEGIELNVQGSLLRVIRRCDFKEMNQVLYGFFLEMDASIAEPFLMEALNSNCFAAMRGLLCQETDLKKFQVEQKSYVAYIVQRLVRGSKFFYQERTNFLAQAVGYYFPVSEKFLLPEISDDPISLARYLASISNPQLQERVLQIFRVLKQAPARIEVTQDDISLAKRVGNRALSKELEAYRQGRF